ncbi:MAG: hypothetical protein L0170_16235 [Acidobacteria bacterium]|nr:hypothetical protein [Acidobacteriota bacterium]
MERLSGYLDAEKLYATLQQAVYFDKKLQREVFDILRTTDDPGLMQECQHLIGLKDPGLRRDVLECFRNEKNPDRRLAWAYILGTNWNQDEVRPTVLEILDGNDTKTQERMLHRMCLQTLSSQEAQTDRERATARLRLLVRAGETEVLRAAAAGSLRGVQTAEDVKFLIETMLQDSSALVQHEAFESLPSNYQWPTPLLEEQTRAMYAAALDERRELSHRKALASRALQNSDLDYAGPEAARMLSAQERATLKAISGAISGKKD